MWRLGLLAKPLAAIILVFAEIAFNKRHMAIILKSHDMRGHPVQKPAVMAYDQGAAGKIVQRVLQGAHGVDIQIIGGLVQQKHICS